MPETVFPPFLEEGITYKRDRIGMIDWAHFAGSIFSLARFVGDGRIYLVANATTPGGKFIRVTNPDYSYAGTFAEFKTVAWAFNAGEVS